MDWSEENKIKAYSVFDGLNTRDFSKFEKVISDDVVLDFPGAGELKGRKRVVFFLKVLLRMYPRLIFDVYDYIIEEQKVCALWTNSGEDKNGSLYSNRGVTLIFFEDGKITFVSDYFKDTSFTKPKS